MFRVRVHAYALMDMGAERFARKVRGKVRVGREMERQAEWKRRRSFE
jgi:hypothetical protein